MKKTCLILLVLVLVSSGLFAALADSSQGFPTFVQLILHAEVGANNIIKVTDQPYAYTSYEALAALDDVVTSSTVINASNYKAASITVGHLNYFSNQREGLKTYVFATPLSTGNFMLDMMNRQDAKMQNMDESFINYMVFLDGFPAAYTDGDPMPDGVSLLGASNAVYRFGSKAITVAIDQDDFDEALRGDTYSAMIVFEYETN